MFMAKTGRLAKLVGGEKRSKEKNLNTVLSNHRLVSIYPDSRFILRLQVRALLCESLCYI